MRLIDLYTEYVANWLSSGGLILRDKISSLGIRPLFDRYITKKYVTKVWCITSVPVEYEENLSMMIRNEMFKLCPEARTIIRKVNIPTNTNVNSEVYKRQLRTASEQLERFKSVFDSMSDADKITGKSLRNGSGRRYFIRQADLVKLKERSDSFNYVFNHSVKGGQFFKSYIFVQASFERSSEVGKYKKALATVLSGRNIYYTEVQGNMMQYLSNFGPASYIQGDVKKFGHSLMSDENLSHFSPYKTRGLVGGRGALMGVDQLSKLPFLLDFFASPSAQVILWLGISGSGKTMGTQFVATSLAAEGHHINALDIKGGEWEKLKGTVDCLVVSMDGDNPRFVNPLRMDDMPVNKDNCRMVYAMGVGGMVSLMSLMVNLLPDEGNPADLHRILDKAVVKYLNQKEVYEDNPDTFYRTRDTNGDGVLTVISELMLSKSLTDKEREIAELIISRCSLFFRSEGKQSQAFKNEITLAEVMNAQLVSYSFNKNNESLDHLDTLRVFMCHFLSVKKQHARKMKGLHTISVYEELQRSDQFGDLLTAISHDVTGSRSNNNVIILLLNALSIFDNKKTHPIKSNITTVICGKIKKKDIEILEEDFDCEDIGKLVRKISLSNDLKYKNNFAIKYDTGKEVGKTIFRVELPPRLEEEWRTRDVVEKKEVS